MFCEIGPDYRDNAKEKFKNRLTERINEKFPGITNRKLADKTGISPSFMNSLKNGTSLPSLDNVFKLSYGLDVSPFYFTDGLELHIKPTNFDPQPDSSESEMEYKKKVSYMYDIFFKDKEAEEKAKGKSKLRLIPEEIQLEINDNSMSSFSIFKKSTLLYRRYDGFVNGQVYVIKVDGEIMVRRIWKTEDGKRYILIPCSDKLYDIIEKPCDDESVEFLGIPVNVTIPIA